MDRPSLALVAKYKKTPMQFKKLLSSMTGPCTVMNVNGDFTRIEEDSITDPI